MVTWFDLEPCLASNEWHGEEVPAKSALAIQVLQEVICVFLKLEG